MSDFEIWVYRGSIIILLGILWYLAKGVLKQLKEINSNIKVISDQGLKQEGDIKLINEKVTSNTDELKDHEKRIRVVEKVQDSCPSCKK